jgi:hypothetical protein
MCSTQKLQLQTVFTMVLDRYLIYAFTVSPLSQIKLNKLQLRLHGLELTEKEDDAITLMKHPSGIFSTGSAYKFIYQCFIPHVDTTHR